jgi:hypothetical protein
MNDFKRILQERGFALIQGIFQNSECDRWIQTITTRLCSTCDDGPLRKSAEDDGNQKKLTYGSRNLLSIVPEIASIPRHPLIREACSAVLGPTWGVVRALFFDKPPGASWGLPWHQDLSIAVQQHPKHDNASETVLQEFCKPTLKSGICHLEAPSWLLDSMLTLRIHLDSMGPSNGPLYVRSGSHLHGKSLQVSHSAGNEAAGEPVYCERGTVMFMRPLLSHASISSRSVTEHRRIVHIELSSVPRLPAPIEWHTYLEIGRSSAVLPDSVQNSSASEKPRQIDDVVEYNSDHQAE